MGYNDTCWEIRDKKQPAAIVNGSACFGRRRDQTACKPGSVPPKGGDGHSSGPHLAVRFSRPTRTPRTGDGPTLLRRRGIPIRSCSRRGLPCRPCHQVRGGLLPHPFTLSAGRGRRWFAFCGAIPGLAPGGRYPPPCRRGARTFLDAEAPRPPGRLIRSVDGPLTIPRQISASSRP